MTTEKLFETLLANPALSEAFAIQRRALDDFHRRVGAALGDACRLRPYPAGLTQIRRNIFSTIFIAVLAGLGVPRERLPFCAIVNQCMRAWVTGCDNLLDVEDKCVIPFDLPPGGVFPSVLAIMAADRVLTDLLIEETAAGRLDPDEARRISRKSFEALIPGGLREHRESIGGCANLTSEETLLSHVPRTGRLFQAPVAASSRLATGKGEAVEAALAALREFGLACQILDDIVDVEMDARGGHPNYLAALAAEVGENALSSACRRARELFDRSRRGLDAAGVRFRDREWAALLAVLPRLLRLPDEAAALMTEAT